MREGWREGRGEGVGQGGREGGRERDGGSRIGSKVIMNSPSPNLLHHITNLTRASLAHHSPA